MVANLTCPIKTISGIWGGGYYCGIDHPHKYLLFLERMQVDKLLMSNKHINLSSELNGEFCM